MDITVTARGLQETENVLGGLGQNLKDWTWDVFHQLLLDIVAEARHILQQNRNIDSGTLLASVKILSEDRTAMKAVVGSDVWYSIFIEFGRGEVRPRDPDGWLHWIDKDTGKDVFAKYASPTEAMPFLEPAVLLHTRKIRDVYVDFMVPKIYGLF